MCVCVWVGGVGRSGFRGLTLNTSAAPILLVGILPPISERSGSNHPNHYHNPILSFYFHALGNVVELKIALCNVIDIYVYIYFLMWLSIPSLHFHQTKDIVSISE